MNQYDKVILGAGLYGLYGALYCGRRGQTVLVIEKESNAFSRATYVNQARVHNGYHYPRSLSTARKSAAYFKRFCTDFGFCIKNDFRQIYATSNTCSWTSAEDFVRFCRDTNVPCSRLDPGEYFNFGMCDGAFLTTEYTYDAEILKEWLLNEINELPNVHIEYSHFPELIERQGDKWVVQAREIKAQTPFILNATYASINEVLQITDGGVFPPFKIKYEKCEIILCDVVDKLKNIGITVMDGPFFSIMPFGKTGLHSLTSVTFTPHETSYESICSFQCQTNNKENSDCASCSVGNLGNCNDCCLKPKSAWPYMSQLAKKYLRKELGFTYNRSLYSMKPILMDSEIDDSRPTVIKRHCTNPTMVSVLSGKINTVYDIEEVLLDG